MSAGKKFILKLLCMLLLLHQETDAISRYKPPQTQSKAVQTQAQVSQSPQQVPEQAAMQQMSPMQLQASTSMHQAPPSLTEGPKSQHQNSQQTSVETSSNMEGKAASTPEISSKDTNSEADSINPLKLMNEIKRENHLNPSPLPSAPTFPAPSPVNAFPTPMWSRNQNPFLNQAFLPPQAYGAQPYAAPNYGMPPLTGHPYPPPYQPSMNFAAPKFHPFMGFPNPWFMPYQQFPQPEPWYPPFPLPFNDFEDTASRAASGRRPPLVNARDSPIYYMRLPPTPYSTFYPNFGFPTNQNIPSQNYASNFVPLPFPGIPSYAGFGQTFNLPVNFLANGKPSGIHSFLPNIPSGSPFPPFNAFNARPFAPPFPGNYFHPSFAGPLPAASPPLPPPPFHDSKLTALKQPFYFNGRPEDIYVLQNSLNPLYPGL